MKIEIDTKARTLDIDEDGRREHFDLFSADGFARISRLWVKVGWALRYSYGFAWMGRPVIQLPEDLVRVQEVIYRVRPDVVVETGVAHGGSLIFYASLMKAMGRGRVIGIDVDIRPPNRKALERHELKPLITLIEGSSVDPGVVDQVRSSIRTGETVMVLLDSNHTRSHVAAELKAYAPLVTSGSYLVATDGIMQDLHDVPGGRPEWRHDNPTEAAREFAASNPDFVLEDPPPPFDERETRGRITYWPGGWLRRVKPIAGNAGSAAAD